MLVDRDVSTAITANLYQAMRLMDNVSLGSSLLAHFDPHYYS